MKNLKFTFLSMFMALFLVTACTNNEPVGEDQQQTEESQSITTALGQLKSQFDQNGNVTETDNPAGNIVLDFCFDFVYPLTLSYNNGGTVTVENLNGLINVIIASTNDLFIDGIAFPFDVETFNDDTDTIELATINNEGEFITLLLSCDFDDDDDIDECYEEYDPVCVEITDPSGGTFIITYPNECYALADGFTENNFLDDCHEDYYVGGGFECFEFNYPISLVTEDGEVITINSEEELGNALYNVYIFDFVYPFSVTVFDDDDDDDDDETEVVIINNSEDFEDILEECFDDYDDVGGDDCDECENQPVNPVCIEFTDDEGNVIVNVFPNMCYAECAGFTLNNVIECDDVNNPGDCNEDDIVNTLTQCEWYTFTSLLPQEDEIKAIFNADGTLEVELENTVVTGLWEINISSTGEVFMFFELSEPLEAIAALDWTVVQCSDEALLLSSGTEFLALEKDCD